MSEARRELEQLLARAGFVVRIAATPEQARTLLQDAVPSLLVVDEALPGGVGLPCFLELRDEDGFETLLLLAAERGASRRPANVGSAECLPTPLRTDEVLETLGGVRARRQFHARIGLLKLGMLGNGRFGVLIGTSRPMQRVYDLIVHAAQSPATVLLTGESGTGKELVSRTIHELSPRAEQPFLAINCGAALPGMIDNELFGHAKGSFTGADRAHSGIFMRASGGTLLLDEIGDMPMELQVKLLRALEAKSVMPVGGEKEIPIDVRVIAATNRVPEDCVDQNMLREDLYYRLRVLRIHLPPLRERAGDIPLLCAEYLTELNNQAGAAKTITPDAMALIEAQPWWGNVRELRNTLLEAFILCRRQIDSGGIARLLSQQSRGPLATEGQRDAVSSGAASEDGLRLVPGTCTLAEAQRQLILATLAISNGNRAETARILGVDPKTLYKKLLAYDLESNAE